MRSQEEFIERLRERFGDPTDELHAAYDPWLSDQAGRPSNVLVPFEFDLASHPEQSIYVPKVDAHDPFPRLPDSLYYQLFKLKVGKSMGRLAVPRLLGEMSRRPASADDPTPLPQRLARNQQEGRNTIVVTSHFKFQEFGYFKGLRFLAKRDRANINKGGVVLNKLMSRQRYKGKDLVNQFTPIGDVYFSYPKSASSERFKVPAKAMDLGNALFMHALKPGLKAGGQEIDVALTGSEIKPVYEDEAGERLSHYRTPDIDLASVKLLEEFDDALAATLIKDPASGEWTMRIGDVLDVKELLKTHTGAEIVDMLYADEIVPAVESIVKREVEYNRLAPTVKSIGRRAATAS